MNRQTDTETLLTFLDRLSAVAAESIMPHFRAHLAVDSKTSGDFDPVTVADRDGESAMRALIRQNYPEHGVLGEEFGPERTDAEFVWVIDPIDGTRSFIAGLPVWGTLIGLMKEGRPFLGMMSQPFTGERFFGDGTKAWYRGPGGDRILSTRTCSDLGEATLLTTTPALFNSSDRPCYDRIESAVRLARYGTDCYAYCMVAAGHADVVIEAGLQMYDIVPLIPIVEGAGGCVSDWSGRPANTGGRIIAAGDRELHAAIVEMIE